MSSYQPQPGTIPARVVEYLRGTEPGKFIASAVIAHDLDIEGSIRPFMGAAIVAGLVECEKQEGRWCWRFGDGKAPALSLSLQNNDEPLAVEAVGGLVVVHAARPLELPSGLSPSRIVRRAGPLVVAEKEPLPEPKSEAVPEPKPGGIIGQPKRARFGLWSDETLQIIKACGTTIDLSPDDTKNLAVYLARHVGGEG